MCQFVNEQLVHSIMDLPVLLYGVDLKVLGLCGVEVCKEKIYGSSYGPFQPILMLYMFRFVL